MKAVFAPKPVKVDMYVATFRSPMGSFSCTVLLISNYPQIWFAATRAQRKLSGDATSQAKAYACDRPGYVSLHRREPHAGGSLRVREAL